MKIQLVFIRTETKRQSPNHSQETEHLVGCYTVYVCFPSPSSHQTFVICEFSLSSVLATSVSGPFEVLQTSTVITVFEFRNEGPWCVSTPGRGVVVLP